MVGSIRMMAVTFWAALAEPICAASIVATDTESDDFFVIEITGEILEGDDVIFDDLVRAYPGRMGLVALNSPGGALRAGLSIGAIIYELGFDTMVGYGMECHSACAFIWLSGSQRHTSDSAIIGVHAAYRVTLDGQKQTSGPGNASIGGFLNAINIPEPAIRYITEAGPNEVLPLSPSVSRRLGIEVYEHRGEHVITPIDEPSSYTIARQAGDLIALSANCAPLINVDELFLKDLGLERLELGHARFGGALFADLIPLTIDTMKAEQEQMGLPLWCVDTERQLRAEELLTGVNSPSFDCAKAATQSEFAICGSPELWAPDRVLSQIYQFVVDANSGDYQRNLKRDQAEWLARRERCGSDLKCLRKSYILRISEIQP